MNELYLTMYGLATRKEETRDGVTGKLYMYLDGTYFVPDNVFILAKLVNSSLGVTRMMPHSDFLDYLDFKEKEVKLNDEHKRPINALYRRS